MSRRCVLAFLIVALGVVSSAQATVYRPGLHVSRFSLNKKQVAPDFSYDLSTSTFSDYALKLVGDATVGKDKSVSNPITGTSHKWGEYYVYAYTGEIYLDAAKTYVIGGGFDDGSAIVIDQGTENELVWSQGGTSGSTSDGWVAPANYTPTVTGWHPVKLFLWNWTSGVKHSAPYGLTYNTAGVTDYSATASWLPFADDGSMTLFRTPIAETYMSLNSGELSDGVCRVNLTSLAPYASTFSLVLDGETEPSASAEVEPGADVTLMFPWVSVDAPRFQIKVHGVDPDFVASGDYYEESEFMSLFDRLVITAAAAELSGTSATIAFTTGYIFTCDGFEYPAVEHYLAWGAADAGTDSAAWDHFDLLEGDGMDAVGLHTVELTDLAENGVYAVRVAVKRPDGELFWSEPIPVILSAVNLTAPSVIYENSPQTYSLVVTRTGDAAEVDEPIALAYEGKREDFIGLQDVIVIPAGATSASMPFTMKDNDETDGNRTLTVSLSQGCLMGEATAVSIIVVDDESSTPTVCLWTGGAGDLKWETPGNWENDRVPQFVDTAKFTSDHVTAGQQITVSSLQEIATLEIDVGVAFKIINGGEGQLDLAKIVRRATDSNNVHNVTVPLWFYAGPQGYAEIAVETNKVNTFSMGDFKGVCDVVKTGPGQLNLSPMTVNDFREHQVIIKDGTIYSNPANNPNARLTGMTFVLDNTEHDVMLWFGANEHKGAFTVRNTGGDYLSTYKHDGSGHTFYQNWDFQAPAYMEVSTCNFNGSLSSTADVRMAITGGYAKFGGGAVDVAGKLIIEKGTISFQDNQNGARDCATEYVLGNENTGDDDTLQLGLGNKTDYPANGSNTIHVTDKGKSVVIYRAGNYKRSNTRSAPIIIDRDVTLKSEDTNSGYGDTYTGVISGVGGVTIKTSTASYLKLAAQNTYAGGTLVTTNSNCRVGSNGAFSTGDVIVEPGATVAYSGMTADEKGEVDAISNGAKLILDEGAVIDFGTLNAAETVGKLIVNGGSLPPGIYGALESGAQHEVSFVTGDGRLKVSGGLVIIFR